MNANSSTYEDSVLLSQDELSEYLAEFGDKVQMSIHLK
jgi:hypothetical protein